MIVLEIPALQGGEDVNGPDTAVLVDIRDLQVIAGTYRRKDLRIALAWAAKHGDELRQAWENMHD